MEQKGKKIKKRNFHQAQRQKKKSKASKKVSPKKRVKRKAKRKNKFPLAYLCFFLAAVILSLLILKLR